MWHFSFLDIAIYKIYDYLFTYSIWLFTKVAFDYRNQQFLYFLFSGLVLN